MRSGPNRHYIPQILMKGFAIPSKSGKEFHVCTYFKNGKVATPNISKIGSARYYYPDSVDNKITDYENQKVAVSLDYLRNCSMGTAIASDIAAPLVVHLSTRHAEHAAMSGLICGVAVESVITETILNKPLVSKIWKAIIRKYKLEKLMLYYFHLHISKTFPRIKIPRFILNIVILYMIRKEMNKLINTIFLKIQHMLEEVKFKMPDIARDVQVKLLEERLLPEGLLKNLSSFQWSVQSSIKPNAILPDCVALSSVNGKKFSSLSWDNGEKVSIIYMPIAHNKILLGKRNKSKFTIPRNIDEQAANCSIQFFLSRNDTQEYRDFISKIGANTQRNLEGINRTSIHKDIRKRFEKGAETQIEIIADKIRTELAPLLK